jgi:hypothetical protein
MATDGIPRDRDRPGRRPGFSSWSGRGGHRARAIVAGAGLASYAWIAGSTAPLTTVSLVIVLVPGVILAVIASWWPPERIPAPDRLDITGVSYWAICVAALFEWEASAFRDGSLPWHPSLTDLINPLLGSHLVKSTAILIWLLVGWALVRR